MINTGRSVTIVGGARTPFAKICTALRDYSALDGIDRDTIIRPDTSLEKLAALPPVFDRSDQGTINVGVHPDKEGNNALS